MALRAWNAIGLCAGAGGLELGIGLAVPGTRGVAYVEREAAAAAKLVHRMETGDLAQAPIWSDLATFDARPWRGRVHLVASGDPCQENSQAGRGLGAEGERFLVPDVVRVVRDCRPFRLFRENVPGNVDGQLAAIVPALEAMGYRVEAGIFSSAETGNSQRRERFFLMADHDGDGCEWFAEQDVGSIQPRQSASRRGDAPRCDPADLWRDVGSANGGRDERNAPEPWRRSSGGIAPDGASCGSEPPLFAPGPDRAQWGTIIAAWPHLEPALCRVANEMADRVDRLRMCGNGVDPLAAAYAWLSLDARHRARRSSAGQLAMRSAA